MRVGERSWEEGSVQEPVRECGSLQERRVKKGPPGVDAITGHNIQV